VKVRGAGGWGEEVLDLFMKSTIGDLMKSSFRPLEELIQTSGRTAEA
jgi:hypothetical protein